MIPPADHALPLPIWTVFGHSGQVPRGLGLGMGSQARRLLFPSSPSLLEGLNPQRAPPVETLLPK